MKKYAKWEGETPAIAIGNMLEFYEGKQAAKGYRERMVEADEIIKDALYQWKGFDKVEEIDPAEMNLYYYVAAVEKDGRKGYQIFFKTSNLEDGKEPIFGLDDDEKGKNKAWLDYWCMRLNRAFVNGWFGAKGYSSWPDEGYYKELDRLFVKMTGKS